MSSRPEKLFGVRKVDTSTLGPVRCVPLDVRMTKARALLVNKLCDVGLSRTAQDVADGEAANVPSWVVTDLLIETGRA